MAKTLCIGVLGVLAGVVILVLCLRSGLPAFTLGQRIDGEDETGQE